MNHNLRCFSAALVFITLISTFASGQNLHQFRFDGYSVNESALDLGGNFSEETSLPDTPANTPRPAPKWVNVPGDVAAGLLIHKVDPEYPRLAKAARVSGIVTLRATISKTGEIVDLHVECGPTILQEPSVKAIREWKYRPYLLNGTPVEVQTTIKVTFALGGKKKLPFSKDSCPVE
jgi:TonB family protein